MTAKASKSKKKAPAKKKQSAKRKTAPKKTPARKKTATKKAVPKAKTKRNAAPKKKATLGRPTKYLPEYDEKAMKLCLLGYIDEELAAYFDVSVSTLNLWKKEFPSFSESLRYGKQYADAEVAHSLFKRATGMTVPDAHVTVINDEVVITPMEKHLAPDVNAAKMWLKNRRKGDWKDVFGHDDGNGGPVLGITIHEQPRQAS